MIAYAATACQYSDRCKRSLLMPDSVNVYVVPGPRAIRLTRLSLADIEDGNVATPIECAFPRLEAKAQAPRKRSKKATAKYDGVEDADDDDEDVVLASKPPVTKRAKAASKPKAASPDKAPAEVDMVDMTQWDEEGDDLEEIAPIDLVDGSSDEEIEKENGWKVFRGGAAPRAKF